LQHQYLVTFLVSRRATLARTPLTRTQWQHSAFLAIYIHDAEGGERVLTFRAAETRYDHGWCVLIRTLVFVAEMNVDVALEIDEYENDCRHILGLDDGEPCATARWRRYKPGTAKIERVAVLKSRRGRHVGSALMKHVMSDALHNDPACAGFRLDAQQYAVPFYEKLGFHIVSEPFLDAGIIHRTMEKSGLGQSS
jgi:predicted GNAT family N-acyltransferase